MPTPAYDYVPQYGVEPFDVSKGVEGGAIRTGENLIATLWRLSDKTPGGSATPFAYSGILIPRSENVNVPEAQRVAFEPGMSGRVGARIFLSDPQVTEEVDIVLAVLNPPEELKQQLAGSVVYGGGDPFDVANYTFLKSQQGQFAWQGETWDADSGQGSWQGESLAHMGSYIDLNLFAQPSTAYFPLLRTDGTDGVAPEAFDMTTEVGVQECIAAVNKGDFFVPFLFGGDGGSPTAGLYRKIWWAHSLTRG